MIEITLRGRGPNTLSLAMLEDLEGQLARAGDQPILLTGAGAAFSAGLDLDELRSADAAHVAKLLGAMDRTAVRLFLHPAPTVAMINGHAVAGGCLIAQCCDVRVGADDPSIRIGMTGVAIGLVYPPFVPAVLAHRLPPPALETVLLGAERHAPAEALKLHLLDAIAPREDLRERASAALRARASLPRSAYAANKRALRQPIVDRSAEASTRFAEEVLPSWTGALVSAKR